jgi:NAD(P)-dependent dehydrogenase (short-subunit alcohol dehydrogenase family)
MSGKVAVVTAGSSGMGAAVARRLAADGLKVAVLSSSGKGEALAAELGGFGVTGSNQSNDDLKRLVDGALARWGRIEALVKERDLSIRVGSEALARVLSSDIDICKSFYLECRKTAVGRYGIRIIGRLSDPESA